MIENIKQFVAQEKTYSLELTDATYEKMAGLETTLVGTPFVVYVG